MKKKSFSTFTFFLLLPLVLAVEVTTAATTARTTISAATSTVLTMAAQGQALKAGPGAHQIYHTVQYLRCGLCKQHAETVAHITSGCSKLTGIEYTERRNDVTSIAYRAICAEYNLKLVDKIRRISQ